MNEYRVLKNFQDTQNNLSLHQKGETVGLNKKRGDELTELGYVEPVEVLDVTTKDGKDSIPKIKEEKESGKTKEDKTTGKTKEASE